MFFWPVNKPLTTSRKRCLNNQEIELVSAVKPLSVFFFPHPSGMIILVMFYLNSINLTVYYVNTDIVY